MFVCHVLFALDIFIYVEDSINNCKMCKVEAAWKPHVYLPGLNMDSFLLLPLSLLMLFMILFFMLKFSLRWNVFKYVSVHLTISEWNKLPVGLMFSSEKSTTNYYAKPLVYTEKIILFNFEITFRVKCWKTTNFSEILQEKIISLGSWRNCWRF